MTKQQRKIVLICLAVIVGSYILRNIVMSAIQMAYYRQAMIAAQQRRVAQKPLPQKLPAGAPETSPSAPASNVSASAAAQAAFAFPGVWGGSAAIEGKGLCETRVELRNKQDVSGQFTGYWSLSCRGYRPLVNADRSKLGAGWINRSNPEAAIFTGALQDGALQFKLDKVMATDSEGCAPTSLTITPFGAGQLASEWQEGTCAGGHMMLHKVRP